MKIHYIKLVILSGLMLFSDINFAAPEQTNAIVESCLACHSEPGLSTNPLQPILDGQKQSYILSQLINFKDGMRQHGKANDRAVELSNDDMLSLATFFAERKVPASEKLKSTRFLGSSKYNTCIGCHGVNGEGRGKYPRLAGMQPAYISKQLKDYQDKKRPHNLMRGIANILSDQEIADLSAYIGSL